MHKKDKALIQSIQKFFSSMDYVFKLNNTLTIELVL